MLTDFVRLEPGDKVLYNWSTIRNLTGNKNPFTGIKLPEETENKIGVDAKLREKWLQQLKEDWGFTYNPQSETVVSPAEMKLRQSTPYQQIPFSLSSLGSPTMPLTYRAARLDRYYRRLLLAEAKERKEPIDTQQPWWAAANPRSATRDTQTERDRWIQAWERPSGRPSGRPRRATTRSRPRPPSPPVDPYA